MKVKIEFKICNECKATKPQYEFYCQHRRYGQSVNAYFDTTCLECRREKTKLRARERVLPLKIAKYKKFLEENGYKVIPNES